MAIHHKPDGYSSVSPYLIVTDATRSIDFLKRALDAELLQTVLGNEGKVIHAAIRIDDTVVMLADAAPDWPATNAHVHVYVPDVDATYARALQHGAESVQAPIKKDDPDKRGGVRDSGGTTWWISTRVG